MKTGFLTRCEGDLSYIHRCNDLAVKRDVQQWLPYDAIIFHTCLITESRCNLQSLSRTTE